MTDCANDAKNFRAKDIRIFLDFSTEPVFSYHLYHNRVMVYIWTRKNLATCGFEFPRIKIPIAWLRWAMVQRVNFANFHVLIGLFPVARKVFKPVSGKILQICQS